MGLERATTTSASPRKLERFAPCGSYPTQHPCKTLHVANRNWSHHTIHHAPDSTYAVLLAALLAHFHYMAAVMLQALQWQSDCIPFIWMMLSTRYLVDVSCLMQLQMRYFLEYHNSLI